MVAAALLAVGGAATGILGGAATVSKVRRDWREGSRLKYERNNTVAVAQHSAQTARHEEMNRTIVQLSHNALLAKFSDNNAATQREYAAVLRDMDANRYRAQESSNGLLYDVLADAREERTMLFNLIVLDRQMIIALMVVIAILMFMVGRGSSTQVGAGGQTLVSSLESLVTFMMVALGSFAAVCSISFLGIGLWWLTSSVADGLNGWLLSWDLRMMSLKLFGLGQIIRGFIRMSLGLPLLWKLEDLGPEVFMGLLLLYMPFGHLQIVLRFRYPGMEIPIHLFLLVLVTDITGAVTLYHWGLSPEFALGTSGASALAWIIRAIYDGIDWE